VVEVEADGVVGVLVSDLDEAINGQILADLVALICEVEVEAFDAPGGFAVEFNLLMEGVPADGLAVPGLRAKEAKEFPFFELLWLLCGPLWWLVGCCAWPWRRGRGPWCAGVKGEA
jgi:hypothetical protein